MKNRFLIPLMLLLLPLFSYANVSNFIKQINYQGKLTDSAGATVADGSYNMQFNLYNTPTGGSAIWTGTLIQDDRIAVAGGLFSVLLGATSTSLSSVDFTRPLYLSINIGGTTNTASPTWDGEMTPRKTFGMVPHAANADLLDGLDSTSLVRTDATSTVATSSAQTLLTLNQLGAGSVLNLQVSNASIFSALNSGRIGIGATTTPGSLFSINGVANFSAGTSTLYGTGGINLTSGCFAVNGACVGGSGSSQWTTSGANIYYTGGSVGVGTTTPWAQFSINPNSLAVGVPEFVIGSSTATHLLVTNSGRIGIGATTTPGSLFSINGVANFSTGTSTLYGTGGINLTGGCFATSGNCLAGTQWTTSGSNIYYAVSAGNVGIGFNATSPSYPLEVHVDQNALTYSTVLNSTSGTGAGAVFYAKGTSKGVLLGYYDTSYTTDTSYQDAGVLSVDSTNGGLIIDGGTSAGGIKFRTNPGPSGAAQRAVITNSGYFGIGTSSPVATLALNGTSTQGVIPIFVVATSTGTATTTAFIIDANGKVGIGTSTPMSQLAVVGNISVTGCAKAATSSFNVTPANNCADLAESYIAGEDLSPGDVVAISDSQPLHIVKANSSSKSVVGIVSTNPAVVFEGERSSFGSPDRSDLYRREDKVPLALVGRVPVTVSMDGGSINVGDPLAVSSITGVAMKMNASGISIGTALEKFDGSTSQTTGKIMVFVNLGYRQVAGTSGEGGGNISDTLFNQLLDSVKNWFAGIKELIMEKITTNSLYTKNSLEVGTADSPAGITLYDQQTKQPYCLVINGGSIETAAGVCGSPPSATAVSVPQPAELSSSTTPPASDSTASSTSAN